jgi:hypothetical protein
MSKEKENKGKEEIDLTKQDEKILDAIWDKLNKKKPKQ